MLRFKSLTDNGPCNSPECNRFSPRKPSACACLQVPAPSLLLRLGIRSDSAHLLNLFRLPRWLPYTCTNLAHAPLIKHQLFHASWLSSHGSSHRCSSQEPFCLVNKHTHIPLLLLPHHVSGIERLNSPHPLTVHSNI